MKITEIKCKSIITKSELPETDYVLNPFVGCSHGCIYCYAKFIRRFTGHGNDKWGSFVDVKLNAPDVLKKQLEKIDDITVLFGSVTDCYMPIESKYKLSRRCLECIAGTKNDIKVSILTKSSLVIRDIDVLANLDAEVGITITTHQDSVRKIFEPYSSSVQKRINALDQLNKAGISTYAFIGPIFPGITDLDALVKRLSDKTDFLMAEALNFRGCDKNIIEAIVAKYYPQALVDWYEAKNNRAEYWLNVSKMLEEKCKEHGMRLVGFYIH